MARIALLFTILILTSGLTAGLSFNVDVEEVTEYSFKNLNYSEEIQVNQEISGNIENIGSIGCSYRLKAVFNQDNQTFERYSASHGLWSGANERIAINYIPINYTGVVQTDLFVEYCGQEEKLSDFEFNVTELTFPGAEMESRTVSVDERMATVEVKEGDLLVPEESPSYWKLSSAVIQNETAEIEYEAPIFAPGEELKYTILEDGEIMGSTEVVLEAEPTYIEKILRNKLEIVSALLGLSVLFNLLLYLRHRGLLDKEKLPDYELPSLKREE